MTMCSNCVIRGSDDIEYDQSLFFFLVLILFYVVVVQVYGSKVITRLFFSRYCPSRV